MGGCSPQREERLPTSVAANPILRLAISICLVLLIARTAQPVALASDGTTGPQAAKASFWADNEAAMNRMMSAMEIHPTGDIDRDFVAMMVPHHQGDNRDGASAASLWRE